MFFIRGNINGSRIHAGIVTVALAVLVVIGIPVANAVPTPISISSTSVNFGAVNVGNTSSNISVTVTNTDAVNSFGPINIFGGAPPSAAFGASQSCQGVTLAPSASCSITYTFTPSAPGAFSDLSSFTISQTAFQADGEDFTVTLAGTGINPITAAPLSQNFGSVTVGTTSAAQSTVITNISAQPFGPINIFGGAPPTPQFGASQNCQGVTLAAGGTCTISYTFSPSGTGTVTDSSNFTISATANQAAGVDFVVSLTGCGALAGQSCQAFPTTTSLSCAPNPSAVGQTVTCIATVTSAAVGIPTGSVTFVVDATPATTVGLNASGQASFVTTSLTAGTRSIVAAYTSSSPDFLGSLSGTFIQTVMFLQIPALSEIGLSLLALLVLACAIGCLARRRVTRS